MTSSRGANVYVGLAGETAPGRLVKSGLYRMTDRDGGWESLTNGLPEAPAIRALAVHPQKPEIVYAGTQEGPYRSTDRGDHWERVGVPDHGHPVWSLLFHPRDADIMYAGYESCEIYRSDDGGERWRQLPVSVRFPDVAMAPGANPAKRVLMMSASVADPDEVYGAVEVGGLIRTLDGGEHWENMSHGIYQNDDIVDTHGVLASTLRPGTVFNIARAGMFSSTDRGEHWLPVPLGTIERQGPDLLPPAFARLRATPRQSGWPPAPTSRAKEGSSTEAATVARHGSERSWGSSLPAPCSVIAFDERQPKNMYCASSGGEVWGKPRRRQDLGRSSPARRS